jgi:hypothetical protein
MLCLALVMPTFQIYRMKEGSRPSFRSAPHTAGLASIKPRDYEKAGIADANSAYAVWSAMNATDEPLLVGDVLESADGVVKVFKYVGFEDARWVLPEVKAGMEGLPQAAGGEMPDASASA